jgi:hypothetical protein
VRRLPTPITDRLPKGWGDLLLQFGLFFGAYMGYQVVRGVVDGKTAAALANGGRIIDFEVATGTFFEPHLQKLLLPEHWLMDSLNWMYLNTHFMVTSIFLIWLYLRRNESFYFVRNMLLVAMGLALAGYALFPTAPPRMIPGHGFVDTVAAATNGAGDKPIAKLLINPYAAIPSMHMGVALMIAVPGFQLARRTVTKAFWCCYPALVLLVIVGTANHFWFDAACGALVACISAAAAHRLLAPARPNVWSWRIAAPERATA